MVLVMKVAKWGNSLAIRLPAEVVDVLGLKAGDEVEVHAHGCVAFEIVKAPTRREVIERLRKYEGRMPADFKFDREEANERG